MNRSQPVARTLFACLLVVACAPSEGASEPAIPTGPTPTTTLLKVSLAADGRIALDGVAISLGDLRARLASAKGTDAAVLYYREDAGAAAPPAASAIVQAVIDNRLPISLSTEPDFSTVVLPDGSIRPR